MPLPLSTMARTPRHSLPFLFPGQAQKEAFMNEALVRLDALVQPSVLDERAEPPAAPVAGDCYLVADPAGGAWTGQGRSIALWAENQWLFQSPREGAWIWDRATQSMARFSDGTGWVRISAPALPDAGAVQDSEARTAIGAIVAALTSAGIFSAA